MGNRITISEIRNALDAAETNLERCWSLLATKKRENAADILQFQPLLLRTLADAEIVYRKVVQEQKALISRKEKLTSSWFIQRMAKLDQYAKCINIVLGIGRALGDGFAWIFYRDEDALIREHLRLQRQPMLPPGIGGRGERIFLEQFQNSGGNLAIYHGLTTFLRIGDFSFFDPVKQRITAIGELKTVSDDESSYRLQMHLVGKRDSSLGRLIREKPREERKTPIILSESLRRRLARQMERIISVVKATEKTASHLNLSADKKIDFSKLQSVLERSALRRVTDQVVGKGVLLVAVACPGTIAQRELKRSKLNWAARMKGIEKKVVQIVNPGASDNTLLISTIGFSEKHVPVFMAGTPPIFWWPLENNQKRDLVFGRVVVLSLYNPSHFLSMLRRRGYEIKTDIKGKLISAAKRFSDERVLALENFSYFQYWSSHYLLDEDVFENLIETMERECDQMAVGKGIKIQIEPKLFI